LSRHAVITGASSGIGAATARALQADGWTLTIGARREERLAEVAARADARPVRLDVTDAQSVEHFISQIPAADLLVCSAGGAIGLETVEEAAEEDWRAMWEANVIGTVRVVKGLLPTLLASGDGQIILIGSIAGLQAYPGGGGYNAAKFALRAIRDVLRLELLGRPIRVSEIDPGMVDTEFSTVRFRGDRERAARVYEGMTPLTADDIGACVAWVAGRPSHVNIDRIVVLARDQADARTVSRREDRS
jgi:NADP-dependent 3-hydroxy acid dehydrogenase YdfG